MGHAMLALVAWAQRCCLLSRLALPSMPLSFRSFGAAFAWSVADVACAPPPELSKTLADCRARLNCVQNNMVGC